MSNVIIGTGSYLPDRIVTNDEIASWETDFDPVRARATVDEWCRKKTGAGSRHYARPDEGTSDMITIAAQRALDDAGLNARDIDLLVLATFSGDYRMPQTAGLVQANLGMRGKFVEVNAACSGFVDSLMAANGLMNRVGYERALVVAGDTMSRMINPRDFKSVVTFGDAAGAVVLARRTDVPYGLKSFSSGSNGEMGFIVWIPGGGAKNPLTPEALAQYEQYISLNFPPISPYAVDKMSRATLDAVRRAGIALGDVKWIVPHQASTNIIRGVARGLELPVERFVDVFEHAGNTSAASIPVALDEANRSGCFADGDWLVLPAVGAGMAWNAACLIWHDYRAARRPA